MYAVDDIDIDIEADTEADTNIDCSDNGIDMDE
ncbi:hypothetical protein ES702_00526 [subsurface metagenome]